MMANLWTIMIYSQLLTWWLLRLNVFLVKSNYGDWMYYFVLANIISTGGGYL